MEPLPYVDEHVVPLDAPPAHVWAAVSGMLASSVGKAQTARVLGCQPNALSPGFSGAQGQTLPGFEVTSAAPDLLELTGRHHFSRYRLTFVYDGQALRAVTHAAFPGVHGRAYRAAVIGSGLHRRFTRRMLAEVARRAQGDGGERRKRVV